MTSLILGASGATGRKLVEQLLQMNQEVKIIVRSPEKLPESWQNNSQITIIKASVSEMTVDEMANYLKDCHAVASCLGHNLTLKGIFGNPRKLVRDAVILLCQAIEKSSPEKPVKFVLMNTIGNRNRDLNEPISFGERLATGLLRLLVPPHSDNEQAADHLKVNIGQNHPSIEWVAVRPDSLIDLEEVTEYELHPSPTRSPIFNAGKTSRINVGHFMAALMVQNDIWDQWKGQMPVIYNKVVSKD